MKTFLMTFLKLFWLKIVLGVIVLVAVVWAFRSYSGSETAVVEPKVANDTAAGKSPMPSPALTTTPTTVAAKAPDSTTLDPDAKRIREAMTKVVLVNDLVLGEQSKVQLLDDFAKKAAELHQQELRLAEDRADAKAKAATLNYIVGREEAKTAAFGAIVEEAIQNAMAPRTTSVPHSANPCAGLSPRQRRICEENRRAQEMYRN